MDLIDVCFDCGVGRRQALGRKMKTSNEETGRASWIFCCRRSALLWVSATSGDFLSAPIKTAAVRIYTYWSPFRVRRQRLLQLKCK